MLTLALPALADSVLLPDARFALALYCNPSCGDTVLDQLDSDLAGIESVEGFSDFQGRPARVMGMAGTEYGIPDQAFISAFGHDIGDSKALRASKQVVIVWFAGPRADAMKTFAAAHAAFAKAAASAHGWIEDVSTGALYGPEAWAHTDPAGALDDWFVIDSDEAEGGKVRLVTRGLRRYGDADLVVEDVDAARAADASVVLMATAHQIELDGDVGADVIVNQDGVRGTAHLSTATPRDDDPEAPLYRLRFDGRVKGDTPVAAASEAPVPVPTGTEVAPGEAPLALPAEAGPQVASVAGVPKETEIALPVGPPTSLDEAKARVRGAIDGRVRQAFEAGLPSGDVVAVSVPFRARSGAKEYLWVEIERWSGDALVGKLATEPTAVEGLRKGDRVSVKTGDVFDYVWKHADGSREGNVTRGLVGSR